MKKKMLKNLHFRILLKNKKCSKNEIKILPFFHKNKNNLIVLKNK
jgi:hypothetical protein